MTKITKIKITVLEFIQRMLWRFIKILPE